MNVRKAYRRILFLLLAFLVIGLALLVLDIMNRKRQTDATDKPEKTEEVQESPTDSAEQIEAILCFPAPGKPQGVLGILNEERQSIRRSASTTEQARLLLDALAAGSREGNLAVIPPGVRLRQVYLLGQGQVVLNYSQALAENGPEGVEGELALVYAIVNTLARNIPEITRVRILIEGTERETLGGHLDISGFLMQESSLIRSRKQAPNPVHVQPMAP